MKKIPPFAHITVQGVKHQPVRVLVNCRAVAAFPDWAGAEALAARLDTERRRIERELKRDNPAKYWQLRCEAVEALARELEAKITGRVDGELKTFFGRVQMLTRNRASASKPRQARRSPLRQCVVDALRPLRGDGLTLDAALRSLTHSPDAALRVVKVGDCWRCDNEDEDWPPELLTREQMNRLFKSAKTGRVNDC